MLRAAKVGLVLCVILTACGDTEGSLPRGDALWADSAFESALAEYRLAIRDGATDEALGRIAHAYAITGNFDRARQHYDQLLQQSPEYTDQAIFDYITLARRAHVRNDRYGMANAVDAAIALRPGLPLNDLSTVLARYYAQTGDADRALDFYERALASASDDSVPSLLFELASVQQSRGNCAEAIGVYNAYRTRAPGGPQAEEARWNTGNCAFVLAREAQQEGRTEDALRHLGTVIDLGVPQNLLDQAWFERGEALLAQNRADEALEAFYRVLELNPARRTQLTERAQSRIDQLRFGAQ